MPPAKSSKSAKNRPELWQLNFAPGSYLESTSRPLYALLFLLPLILLYEVGTIWVNTDQVHLSQQRVVTFIWLFKLAQWVGMRPVLAWAFPGFVAVVILLCWQFASRQSWEVRLPWLGGMGIESAVLALPLLALNAAVGSSTQAAGSPGPAPQVAAVSGVTSDSAVSGFTLDAAGSLETSLSAAAGSGAELSAVVLQAGGDVGHPYMARVVTSIGAGIYEELIFRLVLIGLLLMLFEDVVKLKAPLSTVLAVAVSALLFAVHHYIGINGGQLITLEQFAAPGFVFRTMAGVYFAVVFRYRGYGITAGAHAAYNIILKTLWA